MPSVTKKSPAKGRKESKYLVLLDTSPCHQKAWVAARALQDAGINFKRLASVAVAVLLMTAGARAAETAVTINPELKGAWVVPDRGRDGRPEQATDGGVVRSDAVSSPCRKVGTEKSNEPGPAGWRLNTDGFQRRSAYCCSRHSLKRRGRRISSKASRASGLIGATVSSRGGWECQSIAILNNVKSFS